ncbi:MAG: response regulator, partial [Burkholderiaceae bacterium]
LILPELNIRDTDGRVGLVRIKTDKALKSIPVVVMTTSKDDKDIQDCYRVGANSYVLKPVNLEGFFDATAGLREHRIEIVLLPETKR